MSTNHAERWYAQKLSNHVLVGPLVVSSRGHSWVACSHPDHGDHTDDRMLRPGNRVHVLAIERDDEWTVERLQCLTCEPPYGLQSVPEKLRKHDGAIIADATLRQSGNGLMIEDVHVYDGHRSRL